MGVWNSLQSEEETEAVGEEPGIAHSVLLSLLLLKRVLASHWLAVLMYEVPEPPTTWVAVTVEASAPSGASPVMQATAAPWVEVEVLLTLQEGAHPDSVRFRQFFRN